MANALSDAGLFVTIVNPHLIKNFGNNSLRKVKSDPADAKKIARYTLDNWADLRQYSCMDNTRAQLKTLHVFCSVSVLQDNTNRRFENIKAKVHVRVSCRIGDLSQKGWVIFMRMFFKQRMFSWFDSYDIYDETGGTLFTVKGELSWGRCFRIYDNRGCELGMVKQKAFALLPKFEIWQSGNYVGCISKELTFLSNKYNIDFNGWHIDGNWFEWDYMILGANGMIVAQVSKELFHLTDTYVIDVANPNDALCALMFMLAIDAEKCSRSID